MGFRVREARRFGLRGFRFRVLGVGVSGERFGIPSLQLKTPYPKRPVFRALRRVGLSGFRLVGLRAPSRPFTAGYSEHKVLAFREGLGFTG